MAKIHIYTGDGKGKTSAAVGLAVRMAGRQKKVAVVRFLKSEDSGEVFALRQISGVTVIPLDKSFGFVWNMKEEEKEEASRYYHGIWEKAMEAARQADLLVLDELMAVWKYKFVDRAQVLAFLKNLPQRLEVAMTGRDAPQELLELADYVTEMKKVKHPFDGGLAAREGVEY